MEKRVFVNGRFLTQSGTGVQRFALETINALGKIRDDIVVIVPARELCEKPENVPLRRVGKISGHLWEQFELANYLRSQGSPLLVNLCNTAPLLYSNKISTVHDISVVRFSKSYSTAFRTAYRLELPSVIRTSKSIVTVSEFSRSEISSFYHTDRQRIHVVPNAVSEEFNEGVGVRRSGNTYFLAVGSLATHKNLGRLLAAFASLRRQYSDARLVLAGGVSRSFADFGIDADGIEGVTFAGRVDDSELVELYQGATALVFPSRYEGFGIPALEAQACGCPVVASRCAAMPEVLGDSVLYFDPESTVEMVSAMEQVWIDSRLREELVRRGRCNVRRFSWGRSAQILSEVIELVVR